MTNTATQNRPKHERETFEFAAMVRRMLRAHGRRVADADPEDLAELVALRGSLESAIADAVVGQKRRGDSWAEIARGLGTSRQYAQRVYGPLCPAEEVSA